MKYIPRIYVWSDIDKEKQNKLLSRSEQKIDEVEDRVRTIVEDVRRRGDEALIAYAKELDDIDLSGKSPVLFRDDLEAMAEGLDPKVGSAIDRAVGNVRRFHAEQIERGLRLVEVEPGVLAGERARPLSSAGLYVPRGRGSFPSMLYMLAVPASVAGVGRIAVATPPESDGSINPAVAYAAKLCGVHEVLRIGGAHAVAALAYGTKSVVPVDKIVGPGSVWVAAAQRIVGRHVAVGLPAGPSESMIIADDSAAPETTAHDLLIEAEHGSDSAAILVACSTDFAEKVAKAVGELVPKMPEPRRSFVADVFASFGSIIVVDSMEEAADVANRYAPEHLQIRTADPWATLERVQNAGEVLLGEHTPFSAANYLTGANAVLPTGGSSRAHSAASVRDFVKYTSVVRVSRTGLDSLADSIIDLADFEGFYMHAEAIRARKRRDKTEI